MFSEKRFARSKVDKYGRRKKDKAKSKADEDKDDVLEQMYVKPGGKDKDKGKHGSVRVPSRKLNQLNRPSYLFFVG